MEKGQFPQGFHAKAVDWLRAHRPRKRGLFSLYRGILSKTSEPIDTKFTAFGQEISMGYESAVLMSFAWERNPRKNNKALLLASHRETVLGSTGSAAGSAYKSALIAFLCIVPRNGVNLQQMAGKAFSLHYVLLLAAAPFPKTLFDHFVTQLESFLFYYIFTKTPTKDLEKNFSTWADELRTIAAVSGMDAQAVKILISPRV